MLWAGVDKDSQVSVFFLVLKLKFLNKNLSTAQQNQAPLSNQLSNS
jgi:hypothetical protein